MRITTAGLRLLGGLLAASLAALALAGCGGAAHTVATDASGATTVTRTATTTHTPSSSASTTTTAAQSGSGGASVSSGATATTTAPANGTPPCTAATLALAFLGQQGATGHGELGFALRNTGGSRCATVGYPGVQFLDRTGGALPTTPTHTTGDFFGHTSLRALTVAPGQSVSFRLGVTHGAGQSTGCTTARALRAIAPNDTATLTVAIADGAAECAAVTVSPLQTGDSAYP